VSGAPGRALRGTIATHGDHRIAMAFAILGARAGNAIRVDDPDCVAVSYPGFWADLHRATT
jgi:3-phosphoshikimate 1-carboxyvinyltransferase